MLWDIRPYDGMGPLRFGMSPQQVGSVFGRTFPVSAVHPVFDGSKNEFRTMDVPVCNYMADVLHAIDTNPRVDGVAFKDLDIYRSDVRTVLARLERENMGAKADLGMVLFDRLGIVTSGFFLLDEDRFARPGVDDRDSRGVGVFRRGGFDALLPGFKEISFLST